MPAPPRCAVCEGAPALGLFMWHPRLAQSRTESAPELALGGGGPPAARWANGVGERVPPGMFRSCGPGSVLCMGQADAVLAATRMTDAERAS